MNQVKIEQKKFYLETKGSIHPLEEMIWLREVMAFDNISKQRSVAQVFNIPESTVSVMINGAKNICTDLRVFILREKPEMTMYDIYNLSKKDEAEQIKWIGERIDELETARKLEQTA